MTASATRPAGRIIALTATLVLLAGALVSGQAAAQQHKTSVAGILKCDIASGLSFVFGSTRKLDCVFTPGEGPLESYSGTINKFGVDIGYLQGGVLLWQVIAPSVDLRPGALAGSYVGASAEIAAGAGLGANALVGTDKVMLNPLSVEGVQGLNIAAGVAAIELRHDR